MRKPSLITQAGIYMGASLTLVSGLAGACKAPATIGTDSPSPTASSTSTGPGATVINNDKFAVGVKFPDTIDTYMHLAGDWTKRCEVDPSTLPAGDDILCYLEIAELDMYFHPFTVYANAPTSMCKYVLLNPYWFYQYPPGTGPTNISYSTDAQGHIFGLSDDTVVAVPSSTPPSSRPENGPFFDYANQAMTTSRAKLVNKGTQLACLYDYTSLVPPGPNCCEGSYTAVMSSTDPVTGAVKTSVTTGDWGGSWGNCAQGPGALPNFGRTFGHNLPEGQLFYSAGVQQTASLDVPSVISNRYGSLVYSANFVTDPVNGLPGALKPTFGSAMAPKPPYVRPAADPANPYYELLCLDHGMEVIARARVMIRKWNEQSELAKGAAGNPNTTGPEANFPDQQKEDRADWDDFAEGALVYGIQAYPGSNL